MGRPQGGGAGRALRNGDVFARGPVVARAIPSFGDDVVLAREHGQRCSDVLAGRLIEQRIVDVNLHRLYRAAVRSGGADQNRRRYGAIGSRRGDRNRDRDDVDGESLFVGRTSLVPSLNDDPVHSGGERQARLNSDTGYLIGELTIDVNLGRNHLSWVDACGRDVHG
jgi:hypothetical protein